MPTYRMAAPDGQTYQIDGPEGASDDQVREQIIKQNPHLGGATPTDQPEFQAPPREGVLGAPIKRVMRAGKAVADVILPPSPDMARPWAQGGAAALELGFAALMPHAYVGSIAAGEALRPLGEMIPPRTHDQMKADLDATEASLARGMQNNDSLWVHNAQVRRQQILDEMQKSEAQRRYESGQNVTTGVEMLGGALAGKPFKFRGPVAAETPAAAFMGKTMARSLKEVPKPLPAGHEPIVDMQAIQEPSAPPAPPARQIRRPFEEAPTVIEPQPKVEPFTIPATPEPEPLPTASQAAQERTGGQIPPREPVPSSILDAQGRPILPTPEPGQGTAERLVSPPVPETPLAPAEQPSLLKEVGQIAEERTGGAIPPRVPNEPDVAAMGKEADRTIQQALGESDTPTTRLMRKGKGIAGGGEAEDVGWVTPEGQFVPNGRGPKYELTHSESIVSQHGQPDIGAGFENGYVRYVRSGPYVNVETGPAGVENAIKYLAKNGRYARGNGEIIVEYTDPANGIVMNDRFRSTSDAIEYLRNRVNGPEPVDLARPPVEPVPQANTETPTTRLIRKGKGISGGSDAPIEQPLKTAREIGMRRKPAAEPEAPAEGTFLEQQAARLGKPYDPNDTPRIPGVEYADDVPTAPETPTGPRMLRGSENKTALQPAQVEQILAAPPKAAPNATPQPGTLGRAWNAVRGSLPKEMKVLKERPASPVITEMEQHLAQTAHRMHNIVAPPTTAPESMRWWSKIREMDPQELKQLEADAVAKWKATGDLEESIKDWPQALKDYIHHRNDALLEEQASREQFGQKAFKELPGPYLPHVTNAELDDVLRIRQGESTRLLQTTVKGAQEHRQFETMLEGEAAGHAYVDPRNAILIREYNGIRETGTARLLQGLERTKGIFKTIEEAKAASPTGQAFAIEGIPGAETWYTATNAEREFLKQNLIAAPRGINLPGVTSAKNFADTYMRTPNLINPYPHALKNMGAKYLLARGPVGAVKGFRDVAEYKQLVALDKAGETVPELYRQFREFMPYAEAEPAYGEMRTAMVADKAPTAIARNIKRFNSWSSRKIFQEIDPGLRYSLFKHYIEKGMVPQEAANNAWIDLVRYGTRSEATDFWKSIPTNFFVPWRVGTYQSVWKAARNHPIRTALTIGAIDELREIRYNLTGRWTHLPWDYIEGPISLALEHVGKGEVGSLTWEAGISALMGPGGEQAARGVATLLTAPKEPTEGKPWYYAKGALKIFWGLSQIGESVIGVGQGLKETATKGDPSKIINAALAFLISERDTITRDTKTDRLRGSAPHRLLEGVPALVPKSRLVRAHEQEAGNR